MEYSRIRKKCTLRLPSNQKCFEEVIYGVLQFNLSKIDYSSIFRIEVKTISGFSPDLPNAYFSVKVVPRNQIGALRNLLKALPMAIITLDPRIFRSTIPNAED